MTPPKRKVGGVAKTTVQLESTRLYTHLGRITDGGIIEGLEPIGAASVPELAATSATDIGLAVWPFPLTKEHRNVVASLGYAPVTGYEDEPEQRFFNRAKNVQLFFVMAGSSEWTNYLLIRDFLRRSERARQAFTDWNREGVSKAIFFTGLLKEAGAWWTAFHGFAPVERVVYELGAFGQPWFISSGWALELFTNRVTRVHHDVDVVVSRTAISDLRQYLTDRGWRLVLPLDGQLEPWPLESPQEPQIQVHAHREGLFIDFLLSDVTAETWTYRRDPRISCPAEQAFLQSPTGIPFLAPELVLLFKSKNTGTGERVQDERDFAAVYPRLDMSRKRWLRQALSLTDPGHGWLESL